MTCLNNDEASYHLGAYTYTGMFHGSAVGSVLPEPIEMRKHSDGICGDSALASLITSQAPTNSWYETSPIQVRYPELRIPEPVARHTVL